MKLIVTAPRPVLMDISRILSRKFSIIEQQSANQICRIDAIVNGRRVNICNFLARETTKDILTLFWMKYSMIFGLKGGERYE